MLAEKFPILIDETTYLSQPTYHLENLLNYYFAEQEFKKTHSTPE